MSSSYKFLAILLVLNALFALADPGTPPHADIYSANLALAQKSPLQTMPAEADCPPASYLNPVSCAFFLPVPSPQAGNRLSSAANTSFIWAWGINAPSRAEFTVDSGGCAPDKYVFFLSGEPKISGKFSYAINGYSKSYEISPQAKNPLPANFGEIPKETLQTANASPHQPQISLSFSGSASADYAAARHYFRAQRSGKAIICREYAQYFSKTYSYPIRYEKNYSLEYPPPLPILIQPPGGGQSVYRAQIKSVILSNQQAQKITFELNGKKIASSIFAQYPVLKSGLGFQYVGKEEKLPPYSSPQGLFFSNSTNEFLQADYFAKNNFSSEYYSHYSGRVPGGNSRLKITLEDDFNSNYSREFNLLTRKPSAITLGKTALILDEDANVEEATPEVSNNSLQIPSGEFISASKSVPSPFQAAQNAALLLPTALIALIGAKIFMQK